MAASAATSSARQHIEEIRRVKFSVGGDPNPLTEDLHHAVRSLSAELYTKDVHFLMELIQNAEDNEYPNGVEPSLEFVITSKDITHTGAAATLLVLNNEIGFSKKNIESICSVGRSTKKGRRREGFVGEKGIGFKSVFLVTAHPYIFSHGYQIRFSEDPSKECSIGYIFPQWVDSNPTIADIHQVYGLDKKLPMTTIVLPLKSDKVAAVKHQLSSVHPELLLFLSKIKQVSVRESNEDALVPDTVSAISITSEKEFETRRDINADSHIVFLSAEEGKARTSDQCNYYMWRQRFPVKSEHKVDVRKDVDEWVISLAFPFGDRLKRGGSSSGVYAFLPTEMVTNFPFIIQADFLLASSRETILLDNKWNEGILNCVSTAFVNAIACLANSVETAPISSIVHMFDFFPIQETSYSQLNVVREAIKNEIQGEHIMPCETFSKQVMFRRPCEVQRLIPRFREILLKLSEQGVALKGISSYGKFILHSDADLGRFNKALQFLGVGAVDYGWYAQCMQGCGLILQADEDTYIEILSFLADNWNNKRLADTVKDVPLLKYVNEQGKVSLCSVGSHKLLYSLISERNQWINKWNLELGCIGGYYVLPNTSAAALSAICRQSSLFSWLGQTAKVEDTTVYSYAQSIVNILKRSRDRSSVLAFTHFVYHSFSKKFIDDSSVDLLCCVFPLIDNRGTVVTEWKEILLPATGSKWVKLMSSVPSNWKGYVELGEDYFRAVSLAGEYTRENELYRFIKGRFKATDIPFLQLPDAEFSVAASQLSKEKAILLLEWIRQSGYICDGNKFIRSIKEGKWLRTCSGYSSPSQCFLSDNEANAIFAQVSYSGMKCDTIDERFYNYEISSFKEELKGFGVRHGSTGACEIISKHLMSVSSSSYLSREEVISMLVFIRYLKQNNLPVYDFVASLKQGYWLKSTKGYRSPVGSVYLCSEMNSVNQISDLPLIDESFYGSQIGGYREELKMLGVVVDLELAYPMIAKSFTLPSDPACLMINTTILILKCVRNLSAQTLSTCRINEKKWLKTSMGYKAPNECILSETRWDCILHVAEVPVIDELFYENAIRSYQTELETVGVAVNHSHASRIVAFAFQKLCSSSSLTANNVLSLLSSLKQLRNSEYSPQNQFQQFLLGEKWLRTRIGYMSAETSILFDTEWQLVSEISELPFIDDEYYGNSIYTYKDELSEMGVTVTYNNGYPFVVKGLNLPKVPDMIKPGSVLSLLECIRAVFKPSSSSSLPDGFLEKTREVKWLKTRFGYKYPYECFLFSTQWISLLEIDDVPFIDELFYGKEISSYVNELKALGVVVDVGNGCSMIAQALSLRSNLSAIKRLYNYLYIFKWAPEDLSANWVWIPKESCNDGDWVSPDCCVLSDTSNLFRSRLRILDKYYDKPLLGFFSSVFKVPNVPSIDNYIELWKGWEDDVSTAKVDYSDCVSFWVRVVEIWNDETEKKLSQCMRKIPARSASADGIQLVNKKDVFIPDDIQLKLIFEKAYSDERLFVWYPDPSTPLIPLRKLFGIYSAIGVIKFSESILKCVDSLNLNCELQHLGFGQSPIKRGLVRLVLGFLANPQHGISVERRHALAKVLLDLDVFETEDPITVSYSLQLLSQERSLVAKLSEKIRWEKDSRRLIIKKAHDESKGVIMEFAICFAKVVSDGLLWEFTDHIDDFSRLIQFGCLMGFDMDAVDILLINSNLVLFQEDEEFLSDALPSVQDTGI